MLNYIGDLAPIVRAAAARLGPDGLFAGTVEKNDGDGFVLTPKRRHTHGYAHLIAAIAAAGLKLIEISEAALRQEGGKPVAGLVFAARKSSAD
jgi:predicted TPR repeat methyltransferase